MLSLCHLWGGEVVCICKSRFNPFPHRTHLQQTNGTLKTSRQKTWKISTNASINSKVEIVVAKGEIAHDEQFLLLSQCFQKSSASEASVKRLYAGKS